MTVLSADDTSTYVTEMLCRGCRSVSCIVYDWRRNVFLITPRRHLRLRDNRSRCGGATGASRCCSRRVNHPLIGRAGDAPRDRRTHRPPFPSAVFTRTSRARTFLGFSGNCECARIEKDVRRCFDVNCPLKFT